MLRESKSGIWCCGKVVRIVSTRSEVVPSLRLLHRLSKARRTPQQILLHAYAHERHHATSYCVPTPVPFVIAGTLSILNPSCTLFDKRRYSHIHRNFELTGRFWTSPLRTWELLLPELCEPCSDNNSIFLNPSKFCFITQ